MLARTHGGFTTCLVLRADSGGTITIANAGHIAPYLAGKELPLENGLPLGLSAEATYSESTFHLARIQQVTLVTESCGLPTSVKIPVTWMVESAEAAMMPA